MLSPYARVITPYKGNRPGAKTRPIRRRRTYKNVGSSKGYMRTGGYYGRFKGPNAELKFLDSAFDDNTINNAMEFLNPMVIPQNDTESGRDGRKCIIKSFSLKGDIICQTNAASASSQSVKIALILDTQCNGVQFAATDLLESDSIYAFNNLANSQRFKTIWSKTYTFNKNIAYNAGTLVTSEVRRHVIINKKMNIPIEFDSSATDGSLATVKSNYICLTRISYDPAITTRFKGTCRIRFQG